MKDHPGAPLAGDSHEAAPTVPGRGSARIRALVAGLLVLVAALLVALTPAQSDPGPLEPPDLSSPRAALQSFEMMMDKAYAHWKGEAPSARDHNERAAIAQYAHYFFDLNDIAPAVQNNVGREAAVYVKEVLDRIGLPPESEIPDHAAVAAGQLRLWRIPRTEITLVRIKDGLREGQWVFSSETDERAGVFFERVRKMPYRPGANPGLYDLFVSEPGWMIPREFVRTLPDWLQSRYGGQAGWQWIGLVLVLAVTAVLMGAGYRISQRWSRDQRRASYYLSLVFPLLAVILPQWATEFLSEQVFITGRLFVGVDFALDLVSLGAMVVLILSVTNRVANAVMRLPWWRDRPLNAQLAQLIVRAVGVSAALVAMFEGGRYVGVPLTTLLAGVSVGGLTVALAAQDTLKNLFGSVMILLDRPFQVGEKIRIKGHEGTVESVGLRSTRLRDGSGHLISIPNEEMARLDSKNMSVRPYLRRNETIRLSPDSPPDRLRNLLQLVRGLLANHEGSDPARPPKVKLGIGDDAVTLTIDYYYHPPKGAAFDAFNEKITLQILEGMAREGIRLAPAAGN